MSAYTIKLGLEAEGWAWSVYRSEEILMRGRSPTGDEAIAAAYKAFDDIYPTLAADQRPIPLLSEGA